MSKKNISKKATNNVDNLMINELQTYFMKFVKN